MSELGQTSDPKALVPGESADLRASQQRLVTFGEALARVGEGLKRLDTGGWTGEAADRFHEYFDGEPLRWLECGDAFLESAQALESYAAAMDWAQAEAQHAIAEWQRGEEATAQAWQQHQATAASAVQHASAAGGPMPSADGFSDPGEENRQNARAMLQRAREQLDSAGLQSRSIIDRAQQHAPEEPNFVDHVVETVRDAAEAVGDIPGNLAHYGMDYVADGVDAAGAYTGAITEGVGWVAGQAVNGVGDGAGTVVSSAGTLLGNEDMQQAGRTVTHTMDEAAETVTSSTRSAGRAVTDWADTNAEDIRETSDTLAGTLGAEDPPEPGVSNGDYILIDEDKYPESAQHVQDAQEGQIWRGDQVGEGTPKPSEVTVDRDAATMNRREALHGIPGRGAERLDRDEYPPAMFAEGGDGSSVKYIDASDNRGAGSSMGSQARNLGLEKGDQVTIVAG